MRGVCLLTLSVLLVISSGMGKFFLVDTYDSKGNIVDNKADTNKPENIDKMRDSKRYDNFVEKEDDKDIKDECKNISKIIDTKENNDIAETENILKKDPYHKIEEIINDVIDKDKDLIMDGKGETGDDSKTEIKEAGSKDTKSNNIIDATIQLPDLHRISIKKNNK